MGGQDAFQAPWHMVLDPTAPTKVLWSMDGFQIAVVEGGIQVRDILFSHLPDATPSSFSLNYFNGLSLIPR